MSSSSANNATNSMPSSVTMITSDQLQLVVSAANFAAYEHRNQMRKDGKTPYINHPIGVAYILTSLGGVTDTNVIAAAYLHDTVEDCGTTFEQIEQKFGAHICSIVKEVTDDKSLPYEERKRLQIVTAPHKSYEAKLVKLADKLYNLRDILQCTPIGWTDQSAQQYFEWAGKVVQGLMGTNAAIEAELQRVLAKRGVHLELLKQQSQS